VTERQPLGALPNTSVSGSRIRESDMTLRSSNTVSYKWSELLRQLTHDFNDSEFHTLVFDLGIPYDMIAGQTIEDRFRELLMRLRRENRLAELLALCWEQRSSTAWDTFVFPVSADTQPTETDAEIAAKLIEIKTKFFEDVTHTFWKWRYLAMKVAYYGDTNNGATTDRFLAACEEYDHQVWDCFFDIRTAVSHSQLFVSKETYNRLLVLYGEIVDADRQLSGIMTSQEPVSVRSGQFASYNKFIYADISNKIEEAVRAIANDIRPQESWPGEAPDQSEATSEKMMYSLSCATG
jgi:hypothetical protein